MSERPLDDLTLRDKFKAAERATRELLEHLGHGFIPKTHDLHRLVRKPEKDPEAENVRDLTIRTHAARVMESEQYTRKLFERTEEYLSAICRDVGRIVNEG